jgi:hypothetical protein
MTSGCFAAASSSRKDAMSSGAGAPRATLNGPASATSTSSTSMSSGRAMTTGPGRPFIARWKAWLTISGMRRASSICGHPLGHLAVHAAVVDLLERLALRRSRATWPTRRIIGVES